MIEYYFQRDEKRELWYKLLCYYYAKTELYDRTLTNARSKYDDTEAYLTNSTERSLSTQYAKKVRTDIEHVALYLNIPLEYINFNNNKGYSAQRWIDEYEKFRDDGAYGF